MMDLFSTLLAGLARLALALAALCLVTMTALVGWQVFARFVLNQSPNWAEPTIILLMSWFIYLGAAVGAREGFHLSFDILASVLPRAGQAAVATISDVVLGGFGVGMLVYGWQLAASAWSSTLPALGVSGGVSFIPLAFGGALIILFSVERLWRRAAGREPAAVLAREH